MTDADGWVYDGEWADLERHGIGTYTHTDGRVEVNCYEEGDAVGQGVQWSADRAEAWKLKEARRGAASRWKRRPRSPSGSSDSGSSHGDDKD